MRRRFADSLGLFVPGPEIEDDSPRGAAARRAAGDHLRPHGRLEFNIPGITFGGRYDGSPVIVGDGTAPPPDRPNEYVPTACPGGRPPHAWLDDGRSLFDFFHSEWTLLVLGTGARRGPLRGRGARSALDLQVVRLPQPTLRTLYEAPLALIRPDQIVAWRGSDGSTAAEVVRRVLGFERQIDLRMASVGRRTCDACQSRCSRMSSEI